MDSNESVDRMDKREENLSNSAKRAKIPMYSANNSTNSNDAGLANSVDSNGNAEDSYEMSESPVGAPLKKQYRLEMSKLRKMTIGKKVGYIWTYYKFHIIGFAIAVALIGSIVFAMFNPSPNTALFVAWSAGFLPDEPRNEARYWIESFLVDETENEQVEVILLLEVEGDPMSAMTYAQRVVAMVSAGQIDVFILDLQTLESHAISGLIQPLENILADIEAINPSAFHAIEEYVIYAGFIEEHTASDNYEINPDDISPRAMGINIANSPFLAEFDFDTQNLYFTVSVTSNQIENVTTTLIEFFAPS